MGFQNIQDYNLANNTLGLNDAQLNTTSRVFHAVGYSTMDRIVGPLGASVLLANNDMVGDVSLALPDNQWQIEVENLHNVMMTAFLCSIAEYATGPQEEISQWIVPPQTPIEKLQCQNQILRRNDHMNFSLFAVVTNHVWPSPLPLGRSRLSNYKSSMIIIIQLKRLLR